MSQLETAYLSHTLVKDLHCKCFSHPLK